MVMIARVAQQSDDENSRPSTPQQPLPPVYVSIRELSEQRQRFNVSPEFQRKEAWPIAMKQAFIDTILIGDPIPPMECYEEYNELGEKTYIFNDGHQRITTIFHFVDEVFRTWTASEKRKAEPGSELPVEPKRYFPDLSPIARNHLLDYHVQLNRIRKRSDEQIRTRFLRIQNHMPLTSAEKLNAYRSKANRAARRIEEHPFWANFYAGKIGRDQRFQSSLQLLAIELALPAEGMCEVHSVFALQNLASGKLDNDVTDSLIDEVLNRLDVVVHVYHGTRFTERAACIAMYQSVMFLEQTGYRVQSDDKGALTSWIDGLISVSRRSGLPGFDRPLQQLTRKSGQKTFWKKHRNEVMSRFGLS